MIFKSRFVLKSLQTLFASRNLHMECLPYLNDCKHFPSLVMMFHRIFPNHPYIHTGKHPFATKR